MKKTKAVLWGIVLVAIGVLFALNTLEIIDVDIFFAGWWTFIIIIPCVIGFFTEREKLGNIIGILVGVVLLLCCQNIMDFSLVWKLLVPAIIILVGIKIITSAFMPKRANDIMENMKKDGKTPNEVCATFGENKLNYDGEMFDGAVLTATFGSVACDLRKAIISADCAIRVSATFGGIEILVPSHVNVKSECTAVFGGVSNETSKKENAPTIYISGNCIFGGVEVK